MIEEESVVSRRNRFSKMFMVSRQISGISQENIAAELGVSRRTVQNWEMGKSFPSLFQVMEWFRVLGQNPAPYFLEYLYPKELSNLKPNDEDEKINQALEVLTRNLTRDQKRALIYLFFGEHGSSPNAILQLVVAYLHCDMQTRATVAKVIAENFEICERRGELVGDGYIMPDMRALNDAVEMGKNAAIKKEMGYTTVSFKDMLKDLE